MKKIHLLFILLGVLIFSSCANMHIRKGDTHYDNLSFDKAITHYDKALKNKENVHAERRLARSYVYTNQITKAHETYATFIDGQNAEAFDYFNYGRVKMGVGEPLAAIPYFEKYLEEKPD